MVTTIRLRRGATNVEYVLLMVLCALAVILGLQVLNNAMLAKHIEVAEGLSGFGKTQVAGELLASAPNDNGDGTWTIGWTGGTPPFTVTDNGSTNNRSIVVTPDVGDHTYDITDKEGKKQVVSLTVPLPDITWTDKSNPVYDPVHASYFPDLLYSATSFDGHGTSKPYKMFYDDGTNIYLTTSSDAGTWTQYSGTFVIAGWRHPQVAYDANHFGNNVGDVIGTAGAQTYSVTPFYKMWAWDNANSIRFAYSADGQVWQTNYTADVCRHEMFPLNPSAPVYDLEVIYDADATPAYQGWADNNGRLYNVQSSDGTSWTMHPTQPVAIPLGAAGTWDATTQSRMSVIKVSANDWHAWYGGSAVAGGYNGIGYATSSDGVNWTKSPSSPLTALGGYGAFGGLGNTGTWNANRNYAMSVVFDPKRFSGNGDATLLKMARSGRSAAGNYSIGIAVGDGLP